MTAEPLPPPDPSGIPSWATHARRLRLSDEIVTEGEPRRQMLLYPLFISEGIAAAQRRGSVIDHITARRISLTLLSQSQDPQLSNGLARFASDGALTEELFQSLPHYALRPDHPHHAQSWTLLQYATARGDDRGLVGLDFSARCDEADQADAARAASAAPGQLLEWPAKTLERGYPYTGYRAPRRTYTPGDVITTREWAELDAEDVWGPWDEHDWERDHEIE